GDRDQGVLQRVPGVGLVAEEPPAQAPEPVVVPAQQRVERGAVTRPRGVDERLVRGCGSDGRERRSAGDADLVDPDEVAAARPGEPDEDGAALGVETLDRRRAAGTGQLGHRLAPAVQRRVGLVGDVHLGLPTRHGRVDAGAPHRPGLVELDDQADALLLPARVNQMRTAPPSASRTSTDAVPPSPVSSATGSPQPSSAEWASSATYTSASQPDTPVSISRPRTGPGSSSSTIRPTPSLSPPHSGEL